METFKLSDRAVLTKWGGACYTFYAEQDAHTTTLFLNELANIPEVMALVEALRTARHELHTVLIEVVVWNAIEAALAPFNEDDKATQCNSNMNGEG